MIAMLGNISLDLMTDGPRVGGAPYHCARALAHLDTEAQIFARCSLADRDALIPPIAALGTPVRYVPGTTTASFSMTYAGDVRQMNMVAVGDVWLEDDVPELVDCHWLHIAPLARSDFPAATLAVAARGRRLSIDGQGLVRRAQTGELMLDADFDPDVLRSIWTLKLSEEEADVLGDPYALPVRELLLTHGSRGATICWDGRREHVPSFELPDDPTGAGDAFTIAYVASRAAGLPPLAAARRATAVVALVLAG